MAGYNVNRRNRNKMKVGLRPVIHPFIGSDNTSVAVRGNLKTAVDAFLTAQVTAGKIAAFSTVCNGTNNPNLVNPVFPGLASAGFQQAAFIGLKVGTDVTGLAGVTPATQGFQEVSFTAPKTPASTTGLVALTTYSFSVAVNGGSPQPVSVLGSTATTFADLITQINNDIAEASAEMFGGALRITSNIYGATSKILITDGMVNPLLAALTDFDAIEAADNGNDQINPPPHTASVVINGGPTIPISINGPNAQTFDALISELRNDLSSGTVALVSGKLRITSPTTGIGSTVAITAGTLFPALTDFTMLEAAVPGAAAGPAPELTISVHIDPVGPLTVSDFRGIAPFNRAVVFANV